ncbi:MAG TPA: cupin domain-containing protein [Solirubrobacterales bacterium]|jgi:hypothetical protein
MEAYSLIGEGGEWQDFEVGRVMWLRQEGGVEAGLWACAPEEIPPRNRSVFPKDETILILEGRVRVEVEDGPTVELGRGDAASFHAGAVGYWTVLEPVKEFFVYS